MSTELVHFSTVNYNTCSVPRGTLHNKPPRMKGQLFFYFFHHDHYQEDTPLHHTTFYLFLNFIPDLLFESFTFKFAKVLHMCTTKPPLIEGAIFIQFFVITMHCQEDTPLYYGTVAQFHTLYTL